MKKAIQRNENKKILKEAIIKMDKKFRKKYLSDTYFKMIMIYETNSSQSTREYYKNLIRFGNCILLHVYIYLYLYL